MLPFPPAPVVLPLEMLLGLPELLVGTMAPPVELLLVLTELPPDEELLPLLDDAGINVSEGVTTLAAPLKLQAVLAFF